MKENNLSVSIFFNAFKTIVSLVFPLITFPYISRILGVSVLGKISYYQSIISYLTLIAGLGVTFYAVREGVKYKESKKEISCFTSQIALLLSFSTIFSYLILAFFILLQYDDLDCKLLLICSLEIFFTTYNFEWIYKIYEDFKYISIRSICFQCISVAAIFFMVHQSDDYYKYAMIVVTVNISSAVINFLAGKRYFVLIKTEIKDTFQHLKPILIIFGSTIATTIYMNIDTVMLGYFKGDYDVGIYTVAVKLSHIIKMLFSSISGVVMSRLSFYVATKNNEAYYELLYKSFEIIFAFLIPSILGIFLLAPEAITIISGDDYLLGVNASRVLYINTFFSLIDTILYYQILIPFGKEKEAGMATIVGAISNIMLNMFIINTFSYNGAALTTLISEILVFIILCCCCNKLINVKRLFKSLVFYISISMIIVPIWYFVEKLSINLGLKISVIIITSAVLYLLFVYKKIKLLFRM